VGGCSDLTHVFALGHTFTRWDAKWVHALKPRTLPVVDFGLKPPHNPSWAEPFLSLYHNSQSCHLYLPYSSLLSTVRLHPCVTALPATPAPLRPPSSSCIFPNPFLKHRTLS
jgi:hypothetical protein